MKHPTSPKLLEEHVSVRLDLSILARVDAIAEQLAPLGSKAHRSVALRALILTGLETFESKGGSR